MIKLWLVKNGSSARFHVVSALDGSFPTHWELCFLSFQQGT